MKELLEFAASSVNSSAGNTIFCSLIFAVGAVFYFLGFRPASRRLERHLRGAVAQIENVDRPTAFFQQFEEINSSLRSDPLLSAPWARYASTFIYPAVEGERRVIQASTDPESHFNSESILEPALNLRFFTAVPNYLTGAGILGTFVGLVAGIYLASSGLDNPDITIVKTALQKLLKGASLAFMTSIVGLSCSILFSVGEKRRIHSIGLLVSQLTNRLSGLVERVLPEQLAKRQVEEAVRQTRQLERFNTDFAVSIAEALQSRLSDSFGPALGSLLAATETMATNQVQSQERLLRDLAGQFREALSGAAGTEMASMQLAFREATTGLATAISGMQLGQQRLIDATDSLTGNLSRAVESSVGQLGSKTETIVGGLVKALDEATAATAMSIRSSGDSASAAIQRAMQGAEQISASASTRADRAVQSLEQLVERTENLLKVHASAAGAMSEVSTRLTSLLGHLDESARPLLEIQQRIERSSTALAESGRLVAESAEVIRRATELSDKSGSTTAALWQGYEERFKDVDSSLASVLGQLQRTQEAHMDRVSQFVGGIDQSFTKALDTLSAVVKELMDAAESLQEALEKRA